MSEETIKKDRSQVYKEKLSEIYHKNEDLTSENEKLHKEKVELQSHCLAFKTNYEEVVAQNKILENQREELVSESENLHKEKEELQSQFQTVKKRLLSFEINYKEVITRNKVLKTQNEELESENEKLRKDKDVIQVRLWISCVVIVIMLVFAGVCAVRMKLFEDKFSSEQTRRIQAEERSDVAEKAKIEAEQKLIDVQADQEEAQEAVDQLYGELRKVLDENYGFSSNTLYSKEDIILLKVGQTKKMTVYNPKYYMYAQSSDEEALSIKQDSSYNSELEVRITAQQPGIFTVNCAAYRDLKKQNFEEEFNILVIVLEEEEKQQETSQSAIEESTTGNTDEVIMLPVW